MQPYRKNPRARNQRSGIAPKPTHPNTSTQPADRQLIPSIFSALLEKQPKTLLIRPLSAHFTLGNQILGKFDPYCRVIVAGHARETRAAVNMGQTPQWRDLLEWQIDTVSHNVTLQVYDRNVAGTDVFVGQGSFFLGEEAVEGKMENKIVVLDLKRYGEHPVGSINLIVDLQPVTDNVYGSQLSLNFQESYLNESQNPRGLGYMIFNPWSENSVNKSKVLDLITEERRRNETSGFQDTSFYGNVLSESIRLDPVPAPNPARFRPEPSPVSYHQSTLIHQSGHIYRPHFNY